MKPADIYSLTGDYDKKIKFLFKKSRPWLIYSLFRTDILKEWFVTESFLGSFSATMLNVLKKGDLIVVDEVLTEIYDGGISKSGIISLSRYLNRGIFGVLFPYSQFTSWCYRNLGAKLFFKKIFYANNLWII